jgi:hypothetical protein
MFYGAGDLFSLRLALFGGLLKEGKMEHVVCVAERDMHT